MHKCFGTTFLALIASFTLQPATASTPSQSPVVVSAADGTFTFFDVPWAGTKAGQVNTQPTFITDKGDIVGDYGDGSGKTHGFLKLHNCESVESGPHCGKVFSLDPQGVGSYSQMHIVGMDRFETIVGWYQDADRTSHGALWRRACDHWECKMTFASFDAPGTTARGYGMGTVPYAVNPAGTIVGAVMLPGGISQAFMAIHRPHCDENCSAQAESQLHFVIIPTPGFEDVVATAISPSGIMVGYGCNAQGCEAGLRKLNGRISTWDFYPSQVSVIPEAVNSSSTVTGGLFTHAGDIAFVHTADGKEDYFDAQEGLSINEAGYITGVAPPTGFLRAPDGTVTYFTRPDASISAILYPAHINNRNWVTGTYSDSQGVNHGFVWKPGR